MQLKLGQPVIEVAAKLPGLNFFFQIAVRGCDYPHLNGNFAVAAQAIIGNPIEYAQELGLNFAIQFTDFIKKQGAIVG